MNNKGTMLRRNYAEMRGEMREADVIACYGEGFISGAISKITDGPSHVMIVRHVEDEKGRRRVMVAESTSLNGRAEVQFNYLSDRVKEYDGAMHWLQLSADTRARLDVKAFWEFLDAQKGKDYDFWQCLFGRLPWAREHHGKWYCSELDLEALEAGGAIGKINGSASTPRLVCALRIYSGTYCQISGEHRTEIKHYNNVEPPR
jgi:hypothetical protein